MRGKKILAGVLAIIGGAIALGTFCVTMSALHTAPIMLAQSAAAVERADLMMSAVCSGDYDLAGSMMYGSPTLGSAPEDGDEAVNMIWDAFIGSFRYEFQGDCYAVDSGVALDVRVTNLDISSVTGALRGYSQAFLNERVAQAEDISEIYDEKNNYREDFVMEILRDATLRALQEDAKTQQQTITLHLVYDQDQWWIMPESALLNVLSGSVSG